VLLEALNQPSLDYRVAEGLPWLVLAYSLASEVTVGKNDRQREDKLRQYVGVLENSRLA
jgi:hypothetical protein